MADFTFYLAAPWAEREQAKSVRDRLIAAGFAVNSRWLDFEKDAGFSDTYIDPSRLRQEAVNDVEDVIKADGLFLLNTQKRGFETSGKAVETGMALALLKPIIIVGERTNVFHCLNIPLYATVDEALEWLKGDGAGYLRWVLHRQEEHIIRTAQICQEEALPVDMEYQNE